MAIPTGDGLPDGIGAIHHAHGDFCWLTDERGCLWRCAIQDMPGHKEGGGYEVTDRRAWWTKCYDPRWEAEHGK